MAKTAKHAIKRQGRAPKGKVIDKMTDVLSKGDGIVLLDNKGLTVEQVNRLRAGLRGKKVAVKVAKNTLIKIALKNAGYNVDALNGVLAGPTMMAIGLEDAVSPAKGVMEFLKTLDEENSGKLVVKGGILEKKALSASQVVELSKLPGREELLSKMLGSLQAPAQNLACVLNNAVAKVVWAVSAYKNKLEGGSAA